MRSLRVPATAPQLAERLGCDYNGLQKNMRRMGELGLIRERGWVMSGQNWTAVWASDGKAPMPKPGRDGQPRSGVKRYRLKPELIAFAGIVRCLREGATVRAMEASTGCGYNNIAALMRFCEQIGFARVIEWETRDDGAGRRAAVWGLGSGQRPKLPPVMTRKEIDARNHAKKKARAQMLTLLAATACGSPARAFEGAEA